MDEYQIQTKAQVQNIEQRKQTKSLIDDLLDSPINQNNTEISAQLKEIRNQINNMTDNNIDANWRFAGINRRWYENNNDFCFIFQYACFL